MLPSVTADQPWARVTQVHYQRPPLHIFKAEGSNFITREEGRNSFRVAPRSGVCWSSVQVEDDSMDLVKRIEKLGSRSGAPSDKVEIADSGEL